MSAKPNRGQQRRRAESPTQSNVISQQLETILNRLTALEQQTTSVERRPTSLQASTLETSSETGVVRRDLCEVPAPTERPLPSPGSTAATTEVAEKFLEAITSLTAAVKPIATKERLQRGRVAARTLPRQERPC
ncbi:unnamed protein product [Danaus chrysippus]|uniref:(African queen) hypothetical protein n=1 Tax=Danaus chrysippus TaxID=151541 RepID=A0A8J2R6T2_9NEOP|nr:unnamed protein product [Danaus chrysippus]CAG9584595.1 unnamed protein product [Danaus chrysippus]